MTDKLLEIEELSVHFHTPEGVARAVDGVSFSLKTGETVGLVGESGCGKSVTSLSILGLIPSPPGRIAAGKIIFEGQNLLDLKAESLRKIRGHQVSMIFQEPMTSLNPVLPIGRQVAEPLMIHLGQSKAMIPRIDDCRIMLAIFLKVRKSLLSRENRLADTIRITQTG